MSAEIIFLENAEKQRTRDGLTPAEGVMVAVGLGLAWWGVVAGAACAIGWRDALIGMAGVHALGIAAIVAATREKR